MSLTHYSGMHSNSSILSPRAYTLVELIVVIAILVVLSTVGFVGYSQYTASSRDGARVSDLRAIYQGVGVSISQKGIAPAPDSPVSIYASTGVLLSLQGSVGESVRQAIGLESGGRDPKDGVGYTYLRNRDKKSVQLMGYFEADGWGSRIAISSPLAPAAYAAIDYTDRYPATFGKELWVLVQSTTNTPLQEVSSYTASGVNLGLTSIATGSGIMVVGNTGSGVSENLSGTGVLARVLSPASLVVGPVAPVCSVLTPWTACTWNTIYAFSLSGIHYLTTPGWCNDSSTPTCSGVDNITKTWNDGGSTNFTTTSTTSTSDGALNTLTLASADADWWVSGIQPHLAAQYCHNMVYGGFSDWFLPATDQLNQLYLNKVSIWGFAASIYWPSTELSFWTVSRQDFASGGVATWTKNFSFLVRCIRAM